MKKNHQPIIIFATLAAILIVSIKILTSATAAEIPPAPTENIYVNDYAAMIDDSTKNQILEIGKDLDKKYKAQIVVVTINTLGDSSIEDYANKLFRNWGIGDKNLNNGVLLLISKDDRKFRIEVGYGLEGAITDGYAGEILDGMKSYFRDENYSAGVLQAYSELAKKVYEEYGGEIPENIKVEDTEDEWGFIEVTLFLLGCGVVLSIFLQILYVIAVAVLYIVNVLLYAVTRGRNGTLSLKKVASYVHFGKSDFFSIWWYDSNGKSGGGDSGGGGFGGGSSGGGGASDGW